MQNNKFLGVLVLAGLMGCSSSSTSGSSGASSGSGSTATAASSGSSGAASTGSTTTTTTTSSGSGSASGSTGGSGSTGATGGSSGGSTGSVHGTPTGFTAMPGATLWYFLAFDANSRLYLATNATSAVSSVADDDTSYADVKPSANGFSFLINDMGGAPDGTIWIAGGNGTYLIKRPMGASAWTDASAGLPASGINSMTAPGFDAAGNGYLAALDSTGESIQMYELAAGSSTWAAYGPVLDEGSRPLRVVPAPDGRVFLVHSDGLLVLDASASTYAFASFDDGDDAVIDDDGALVAEVGIGSGTKAIDLGAADGGVQVEQAFGVSGNGSTDPGGLCRNGAGDLYAGTIPDLWQRPAGSTTWSKLTTTPSLGGRGLHCAPNGRIYVSSSGTLYRSTP